MPSAGPWVQTQATADIIVSVIITSITTTTIIVVTINHGVIYRTNLIRDLHVLSVGQRHWTPEKMKHTEF